MSAFKVMFSEIRHRLLSFLLGLLAVIGAVTLFVSLVTMGRASNTETQRLMRNLGFNLLIVPAGTDLADFWATDFVKGDMPEEYVKRLAGTHGIMADHYVATLEKKIEWRGREVLLTGLLPEVHAVDAPSTKAPMGFQIKPGSCLVGSALAKSLNLQPGQTLEVLGKKLKVTERLAEDGSKQDVRLYANLRDVQSMLKMPDRINQIQALGCLCAGATLDDLRKQMGAVLPDTYVAELRTIATARSQTRKMVEEHVGFIMAAALAVCAVWVGLLSLLNVRDRRQEIGVLRALGFGSGRIMALFLGRTVLMGVIGAAIGFLLGTGLALEYGPDIFKFTFAKVKPAYDLLVSSLVAASVISALAGFLPAMVAVTQDPAVTLLEE